MNRIIISRTDSIGDVVLTLPMAGVIRKFQPDTTILFLGRTYTGPVIRACRFVNEFINWDDIRVLPAREQTAFFASLRANAIIHVFPVREIATLAKRAGIPRRIGTTHRFFTWFTCTHLAGFSRKRADLHEAQLNLKLLKPLGIDFMLSREEIPEYYGLQGQGNDIQDAGSGFKLILHPKSRGSAREWGLENFSRLIELLPEDRVRIFITGTEEEGELMRDFLHRHRDRVTDMTGKLSLPEFMDFIRACDALVAASTGPLHLAAAFGITAIGIYAPMRPIFPTRWAPLGKKAYSLVLDKHCHDCRRSGECHCMKEIRPGEVFPMIRNAMNRSPQPG